MGCSFDFEDFVIDDYLKIIKMDELFQLSRSRIHNHGSGTHETVRGASTHSLMISNYYFNYNSLDELSNSLNKYSSYPIEIIDDIFASLRIALKVDIGYAQIFSELKNVEYKFEAAYLKPLTGTDVREYPPIFDNFGWLKKPIIFKKKECLEFKKIYNNLAKIQDCKWIALAISRLNASFLRTSKEDALIDRLIGIESLITEDSNSEITYRMGLRVAYMMSNSKKKLDYKDIMSKLYSYRSAIVHGDKNLSKKAKFKLNNNECDCEEMSKEIYCEIMRKIITNKKYHSPELGKVLDKEIVEKLND